MQGGGWKWAVVVKKRCHRASGGQKRVVVAGHGVTKQQKIKKKQFKQRSKNNKICRGRCRLAGTTYVATRVPASRVTGFARVQILVPVPVPQLTRDVNPCRSRYPCHSLVPSPSHTLQDRRVGTSDCAHVHGRSQRVPYNSNREHEDPNHCD